LEFIESPLGRVANTAVLTSDVGSVKAVDVTDLHPIILTKDDDQDDECVDVRGEFDYTINWKYWWNDSKATFKLVNNVAVYGVYIDGGSPRITHNRISHNDAFGIYLEGTTPAVTHNYIHDNGYGLFADNNSAPHATNNMIYRKDQTGIYLNNSPSDTVIRNNTIADNPGDGVVKWGGADDPNVVLRNCIVWKNDGTAREF